MREKDFGWTGYKHLGWVSFENGFKYYEGKFKTSNDPHLLTQVVVRFWTNHPIKAMRHIYYNSKTINDVVKFNEKQIIL